MNKKYLVTVSVLSLFILASLSSSLTSQNLFGNSRNVSFVIGENADPRDFDSAMVLAREIDRTNKSMKNDTYYEDYILESNQMFQLNPNRTNIIVIGGPCINNLTASLMGVRYPYCGQQFSSLTGIDEGGYVIQRLNQTGMNIIVIIGYEAEDTRKAIDDLIMNRTSGSGLVDNDSNRNNTRPSDLENDSENESDENDTNDNNDNDDLNNAAY